MRALLFKGTPFVVAKINEDVWQGAARKREHMGTADGHILFLADEMLASDWRMREQFVTHRHPRTPGGKTARDHNQVFRKLPP